MVIGFDGSRAFDREKTGTENYSYQLLLHLSKIDHGNQYIVYLRWALQGLTLQGWPSNFKFKVLNFKFLWTQIGLGFQTFTDGLDLLFVPSHTLPLVRKTGLKTVMTVHDLGAEYLPGMHQLKQKLYLDFITKFQLKTAAKLIAVSRATKKDLIKKVGIRSKDIEVIYEGVDRQLFKTVQGDILVNALRYYGLKPGTYFLFVGTIQPRKNLKRLIEAFEILVTRVKSQESSRKQKKYLHSTLDYSDLRLILAGTKGWMSDEIYSLPQKLGIEDKVKFLGRVSDKDLPALYSGAIAFVFPSLFEGFGLPVLEAFACGTPVITSNISSMPEVGGKAAIYVNPGNIKDIAEAMSKVATNAELRNNLIERGYAQVKKFSWEKCAKQTLRVFNTV